MDQYIAQTSRGLVEVLEREIRDLGLKVISKSSIGVLFESDLRGCYRANLMLRTATRVIKPVLEFQARTIQDLYDGVRKHDWTQYIDVKGTLALDTTTRDSVVFKDQRYVTLKLKDGIVDQFRDKYDERPDIDSDNPELRIMVRVVKEHVSMAIDTSGESLSKRGYRREQGDAPLREHLAAGLLQLSGWKPGIPLLDPMCGSGTIIIEAAMAARKIAPGAFRKKFAFQGFKDFDAALWDQVLTEAMGLETEDVIPLYASDGSGKMTRMAEANAERAGVDDTILFRDGRVDVIEAPTEEKGIIIVNPPYGERMGVTEDLKDVYRDFAFGLKRNFKGWTMWMISGNDQLSAALKLKASRKIQVYNGNLDCRFLEYKIT